MPHHYHRLPEAASLEPVPGPDPERAEVAGQPSAAGPERPWAARAHTEAWPPPLLPWGLSWPPWPWHRPRPGARPEPERAKRPAWPPPASPPASSTSSTYLPPLAREFVPIGGGSSERKGPPPTKSYRSSTTSSVRLAASRCGLVNRVRARRRVGGAHVDR